MVLGAVYTRQPQYPVNPLRAPVPTPFPTMRYYRLWIYTCNALLFVSVIGFCVVATKVLVLDPRRLLVPSLSLSQPSFLYAYAALIFQSGFLQFIGCLGAQRLNERLLNIYWLLILALLLGDILLGVVWLFRFEKIATELRPLLKQSLALRYGVDSQFTSLWDAVQTQYKCCGVLGYHDFTHTNLTVDIGVIGSGTTQPPNAVFLPSSCCREPATPLVAAALRNFHYALSSTTTTTSTTTSPLQDVTLAPQHVTQRGGHEGRQGQGRCPSGGVAHPSPCQINILTWLTQTAHILFVLGYCVIAFIKLCFLGILRYEIKEMIQKIKLVQESSEKEGEMSKCSKQNNGTILQAPQQMNNILREPGDTPVRTGPGKKHVSTVLTQDAGTDSDTNSHCALILCDASEAIGGAPNTNGTNGNNNYEMGDLTSRLRT